MGHRALISLIAVLAGVGAGRAGGADPGPGSRRVAVVQCEAPRTLRLDRYEDGSAKLVCNGRLLVRISVPW